MSSYTSSLTSMLTVQKLRSTVTELNDLIRSGEYVGVQKYSFVGRFLVSKGFDSKKFRYYRTIDEFDGLSKGSTKGGIGAYVDEIPYFKLILKNHCTTYTMVVPPYKTAGFGFQSPLVADISRVILRLMEDKMAKIEREWFGDKTVSCEEQRGNKLTSGRLTLNSFKGLFSHRLSFFSLPSHFPV